MLVDEISTKVVKRWAIILMVETVGFLAHMGYKYVVITRSACETFRQPQDFVKPPVSSKLSTSVSLPQSHLQRHTTREF